MSRHVNKYSRFLSISATFYTSLNYPFRTDGGILLVFLVVLSVAVVEASIVVDGMAVVYIQKKSKSYYVFFCC